MIHRNRFLMGGKSTWPCTAAVLSRDGKTFRIMVVEGRQRGYSEGEIDAILVRNPRRLLTFA